MILMYAGWTSIAARSESFTIPKYDIINHFDILFYFYKYNKNWYNSCIWRHTIHLHGFIMAAKNLIVNVHILNMN